MEGQTRKLQPRKKRALGLSGGDGFKMIWLLPKGTEGNTIDKALEATNEQLLEAFRKHDNDSKQTSFEGEQTASAACHSVPDSRSDASRAQCHQQAAP